VSPDFVQAAGEDMPFRNEIKSFFRMGGAVAGLSLAGIHRPTLHPELATRPGLFLFANGQPLDPSDRLTRRFFQGQDFPESCQAGSGGEGWNIAQINHYLVRTPELTLKKLYRGNGLKVGESATNDRRRSRAFYNRMNRNDVEDRSILRHVAATEKMMSDLLYLPGIAEAHAHVQQLHATWLSDNASEIRQFRASLRFGMKQT
jgi:hypothetical protein